MRSQNGVGNHSHVFAACEAARKVAGWHKTVKVDEVGVFDPPSCFTYIHVCIYIYIRVHIYIYIYVQARL